MPAVSEVLRLDPDAVTWREIDGDIVVLDGRRWRYLGANPAAALLWPLLVAGATREQLAQVLRDEWEQLEPERALRDADAFVDWLAHEGLLERAA